MAVAESTMLGEVAIYRHQAAVIYRVVQLNVDGITHEESLTAPDPGGNCVNWVVGHLLCIYEQTLPVLGQEPVMEEGALERYARGAAPLDDPAEALPFEQLLAAWEEASRRINRGLKRLPADTLDEPAPYSTGNDPDETVRSLLTTVFFHQAYHAGQLGLLRRIVGKEGAIR